ncbi:hypothetical protein [Clostridium thermosuccinogenes]|uniref:hypothetical protein n=1 Tax=Clostridium thermosuccinogenes TaxID=84032 RepID=UPI000CCC551F|nr:hypothetical protein [Pseudoclostridium thermosuccinogenes]PNT94144.1 hypothetical protein CDQ83_11895 [Pseudoclostridium thermosuccinogenes]
MIPYFVFNNKKSSDYDIIINEMPPEQYADDEFEYIEIPGRDGYLSINKGRKKPIVKNIVATLLNKENREFVKRWLRGTGNLVISSQPDIFYKAKITKPVIYYASSSFGRQFEVEFLCQPYGYLFSGLDTTTITTKNTVLYNPTDEIAKPLITIYGSGAVDLIINNNIYKFNINGYVTIDSELMECYKDNLLVTFIGDFVAVRPL